MFRSLIFLVIILVTVGYCEVNVCKFARHLTEPEFSTLSGTQIRTDDKNIHRNVTIPINLSEMFKESTITYRCCDEDALCLHIGQCQYFPMKTSCACSYKSKILVDAIKGRSLIQFKPPIWCHNEAIAEIYFDFLHEFNGLTDEL